MQKCYIAGAITGTQDYEQKFKEANLWLAEEKLVKKEIKELGFAKTKLNKVAPTLW